MSLSLTVDISRSLLGEIADFLSQKLNEEQLTVDASITREQLILVLQRDFPFLVKTDGSFESSTSEASSIGINTYSPHSIPPDEVLEPIQTGRLVKLKKSSKLFPKFAKKHIAPSDGSTLSKMFHAWSTNERWCVLTEEMMYIYKDRQSKAPKNCFNIKDYDIRYPSLLHDSNLSFCLASAGKPSFEFAVSTEEEFSGWMLNLEKATNSAPILMERHASRDDITLLTPNGTPNVRRAPPSPNTRASPLPDRAHSPVEIGADEQIYDLDEDTPQLRHGSDLDRATSVISTTGEEIYFEPKDIPDDDVSGRPPPTPSARPTRNHLPNIPQRKEVDVFAWEGPEETYDVLSGNSSPRPIPMPMETYDTPSSIRPISGDTYDVPSNNVRHTAIGAEPSPAFRQGATNKEQPPVPPPRPDKESPKFDYDTAYLCVWDCTAQKPEEISFRRGDLVTKISDQYDVFGWWVCRLEDRVGFMPKNYLAKAFVINE